MLPVLQLPGKGGKFSNWGCCGAGPSELGHAGNGWGAAVAPRCVSPPSPEPRLRLLLIYTLTPIFDVCLFGGEETLRGHVVAPAVTRALAWFNHDKEPREVSSLPPSLPPSPSPFLPPPFSSSFSSLPALPPNYRE